MCIFFISFFVLQTIIQRLGTGDDDGIAMEQLTTSLRCPVCFPADSLGDSYLTFSVLLLSVDAGYGAVS